MKGTGGTWRLLARAVVSVTAVWVLLSAVVLGVAAVSGSLPPTRSERLEERSRSCLECHAPSECDRGMAPTAVEAAEINRER